VPILSSGVDYKKKDVPYENRTLAASEKPPPIAGSKIVVMPTQTFAKRQVERLDVLA
jgi:hypothetical protein